MAVFERSRRELSLDVSVGVRILLVVEQSSLESQFRRSVKTPILKKIVIISPALTVPLFDVPTVAPLSRFIQPDTSLPADVLIKMTK